MFGMGGVKTVIGLDVGSYAVKAVALQPIKGRLTLQGYAQMRVGESDQALVVRQVIEQLGVKPRHLVSSVSGRSVIVRQVETPKLDGDELKQHIAYEADKYIPFGTDEVVIDCQPMPNAQANDEAQNQEVLLVAVRRNFVEDHVTMLQSAGVHPSVVDVDVFALVNAFQVLGPASAIAASGEEDDEAPAEPADSLGAVALVDIGAAKSWVAIVKDGRLLFQREIYLAGNEITDAISRTFNETNEDIEDIKLNPGETLDALLDASMPALEDLANEIRLSFDYVEGQFDEEVNRVVLSGASAQMPQLADILGNILGRPVNVFDPLSGVDLVPSRYDLHGLDANAPSLTVALGLACHELADDLQGLGGLQVATWNAKRGGARGPAAAGGPVATPDAMGDAPPPEPDHSPASGIAMAPPSAPPPAYEPSPVSSSPIAAPPAIDMPSSEDPIDLESLQASMPPAEPMAPPPAAEIEAPDVVPPPAIDMPPPAEEIGTGAYDSSGRSSMLVVLDDDEEYSTDQYRRTDTSAGQDEENDDDGLPPLPS